MTDCSIDYYLTHSLFRAVLLSPALVFSLQWGLPPQWVGSIFGYKTEVVMRIAIAELLVFAYNVKYLLRLTKLKYTHIFIVVFHGRRIYSAYHHKGPPVVSVTKLCTTQSGLTQSESNFVDKLKKRLFHQLPRPCCHSVNHKRNSKFR